MVDDPEISAIRKKKEELLKKIMAMPAEIVHIHTVEDFNNLVEKYKDVPIVIDFWAPWCAPCRMFGPIFEEAQKKYGNDFVFAKLNTEEPAGAVAQALGVTGIPTTIFIHNKREIHRQVGLLRKNMFFTLLERIKKALENGA